MADSLKPQRSPQPSIRQLLTGVVVALGVGVILVFSIGRLAGFANVGDALDGASWQWLALCAVGQAAVFCGYAGAFRVAVAFEGGPQVSTRRSLRVILASFGLTQLVAAGGAAGLAITYWALRRLGFEPRPAAVRLIALNAAVYLVFGVAGLLVAALALTSDAVPISMSLPWLIGIPLVLAAARWFTQPPRVDRWSQNDGGRFGSALAVGVAAAWWVRRAAGDRTGEPVFVWAALYWVGDIVSLGAALHAFDADIGLVALAVAYFTGYLAQSVPIPFIATGGVDAATTFALNAVGVPVEVALLGVVAHRVFAFWLPIGPGLWSAFRLARES